MFVGYDQTWMDRDSSWWAKANRAREHIDSLRRQVDEYRACAPYSLTPEPTEKPHRLASISCQATFAGVGNCGCCCTCHDEIQAKFKSLIFLTPSSPALLRQMAWMSRIGLQHR